MPVKYLQAARTAAPYLCGFAAATALDFAIDLKTLFLPIAAIAAAATAASLILRGRRAT